MNVFNRKGQNTAEYAVLIAVVVGAIVAMQIYVKRGLQAKVKHVADRVGDGLLQAGTGITTVTGQYEPYYNKAGYKVVQDQQVREQFKEGGTVRRDSDNETTTRTGGSTTDVEMKEDNDWK